VSKISEANTLLKDELMDEYTILLNFSNTTGFNNDLFGQIDSMSAFLEEFKQDLANFFKVLEITNEDINKVVKPSITVPLEDNVTQTVVGLTDAEFDMLEDNKQETISDVQPVEVHELNYDNELINMRAAIKEFLSTVPFFKISKAKVFNAGHKKLNRSLLVDYKKLKAFSENDLLSYDEYTFFTMGGLFEDFKESLATFFQILDNIKEKKNNVIKPSNLTPVEVDNLVRDFTPTTAITAAMPNTLTETLSKDIIVPITVTEPLLQFQALPAALQKTTSLSSRLEAVHPAPVQPERESLYELNTKIMQDLGTKPTEELKDQIDEYFHANENIQRELKTLIDPLGLLSALGLETPNYSAASPSNIIATRAFQEHFSLKRAQALEEHLHNVAPAVENHVVVELPIMNFQNQEVLSLLNIRKTIKEFLSTVDFSKHPKPTNKLQIFLKDEIQDQLDILRNFSIATEVSEDLFGEVDSMRDFLEEVKENLSNLFKALNNKNKEINNVSKVVKERPVHDQYGDEIKYDEVIPETLAPLENSVPQAVVSPTDVEYKALVDMLEEDKQYTIALVQPIAVAVEYEVVLSDVDRARNKETLIRLNQQLNAVLENVTMFQAKVKEIFTPQFLRRILKYTRRNPEAKDSVEE
jgi:hypothetical protein